MEKNENDDKRNRDILMQCAKRVIFDYLPFLNVNEKICYHVAFSKSNFLISEQKNLHFLIFLINALSNHQHEYVFETCHLVTTYLQFSASIKKNEGKKNKKIEKRMRRKKNNTVVVMVVGCIETNVKYLQKILFAMTLFYLI